MSNRMVPLALTALMVAGCGVSESPSAVSSQATAPDLAGEAALAPAPAAARYRAQAQASDPAAVVPVWERYEGKTYEDLAAAWWEWALNQPVAEHPLLEATGENAEVGQNGNIWFLGGAFRGLGGVGIPDTGPIVITREVTIPKGKALFFPILNSESDNSDCGRGNLGLTFEQHRAFVTARQDTAEGLSATIDGVAVPDVAGDFRVTTGPFRIYYGPNDDENLTSLFCDEGGYQGTYKDAAADGYWLLVRPLAEGEHVIRFTGTLPGTNPFSLDVTYRLDVE